MDALDSHVESLLRQCLTAAKRSGPRAGFHRLRTLAEFRYRASIGTPMIEGQSKRGFFADRTRSRSGSGEACGISKSEIRRPGGRV
jgi:hypothetical protein